MNFKKPFHLILCLTAGSASATTVIDFEDYDVGSNLPDNGWQLSGSDGSAILTVNTTNSGAYVGGRAIRTDSGGSTVAGLGITQQGITGLQVDMNWDYTGAPDPIVNTPTIQLVGWDDDDSDGIFAAAEREVGLAMDNTEPDFEFLSGSSEIDGITSTSFNAETWYRLTLTWGSADGGGNRDVTLTAYDLTNENDLGVVNTATLTAAQFGADPSEWDGIGIRMTRGTMDNIVLIPEPNTSLLGLLAGGLMLVRRKRQ